MKSIICLILAGLAIEAGAQVAPPMHDWKVTLKVVDEARQPIEMAKAGVFYLLTNEIAGLTDTNGVFVAAHQDGSENLAFRVEKPNYYPFWSQCHLGRSYTFEKWNPVETVILRKVGSPIPMYAKQAEMKFPKEDEPVGYDLKAGDWIAPYGKGVNADLFFSIHRVIISDNEYNADLTVTFPNKRDGIAVAPLEPAVGSAFKTSRIAAENGYGPDLHLNYSNSLRPESVFGYFIRVRTVLDDKGNVKSALYGKISGNFKFYAGTKAPQAGMGFDYYLNPTPNDRNVEFDPKQNLIKGLKSIEEIKEP